MGVYKRGKTWWYGFMYRGETIRESTRQGNKRAALDMESAHKTAMAKGEMGIRERRIIATLRDFAEQDFLPFVTSTFKAKLKTRKYYEHGVKSLLDFERLAGLSLDTITTEVISGFIAKRQENGLQVSSINRELQVLRRMFVLAQEWGKVEKVLPKVRMLSGERHRERVLTADEETRYLQAARDWKASSRPLLLDVATILLDCALRPEECFRLRWESVRDGIIEIQYGKTDNARRRIPVSQRVAAILEMRRAEAKSEWVFPAQTRSGHIEPASVKRQHLLACEGQQNRVENLKRKTGEPKKCNVERFPLYTLRHTCLTRWAPHMDPWTLAHLAGHRDMSITKRYVHPQAETIRAAMERARGIHKFQHSDENGSSEETGTKPVIV